MRLRDMTAMASLLAALAFTQSPANAQSLNLGVASANLGGLTGTSTANTSDPNGGSVATASATGGSLSGGSGPSNATVSIGGSGSTSATGTGPATLVASLGGVAGGTPTGSVTLGTGSVGGQNGTTTTISLGTSGATAGAGAGTATGFTQATLRTALNQLDQSDVRALKLKCADVLGNPRAFDAGTVGLCQMLARL